ncbi:MAG: hypothetical protein Q9227_005693 [Pyrenula ochraceoflavens]
MGKSLTCQDHPNMQAATYTDTRGISPGEQNPLRATITICNFQFYNPVFSPNLDDLQSRDFSRFALNEFLVLTSFVIMHEVALAEPFKMQTKALGWQDIQKLDVQDKLDNPSNYVFFALLARLSDPEFNVRLSEAEFAATYDGILERIPGRGM